MTAFIVRVPFKAKSGEIRKGRVIAMPEDKARDLLAAGKIVEFKPCQNCNEYAWWLSKSGTLRCGVCHPPMQGTVRRWIGDPECYARLKASGPAVILPWVGARQRKAEGERSS